MIQCVDMNCIKHGSVQKNKKTIVKDHLGNEYRSVKKMCDAYGIKTTLYYDRKKRHWEIKDILTTPAQPYNKPIPCTDGKGNYFESESQMRKFHGISKDCYKARRRMGWTKEIALTAPVQPHKKRVDKVV